MAGATLAELMARARDHADQKRSRFVTDTRLAEMVNNAWYELYGILVSRFEDLFITEFDFPLVAGTESYALPDGDPDEVIFKLRGVDLDVGGNGYAPVKPFLWSERGRYEAPDVSGTVRITYVPVPKKLVTAAPAIGEINNLPQQVRPGWDEYVALRAAVDLCAKEQNDNPALRSLLSMKAEEIAAMSQQRDAEDAPVMVRRTTHLDGDLDFVAPSQGWGRDWPSEIKYCVQGETIRFKSIGEP